MVLVGVAKDAGGAAELVGAGADMVVVGSASSPAKAAAVEGGRAGRRLDCGERRR